MSQVQFDEGSYLATRRDVSQVEDPAMIKLVLKTGLVKTSAQANYVLIGLTLVIFILSVVIFYETINGNSRPRNQNVVLIKTAESNVSIPR